MNLTEGLDEEVVLEDDEDVYGVVEIDLAEDEYNASTEDLYDVDLDSDISFSVDVHKDDDDDLTGL